MHPLLIDATPAEINTASELPLFNDFCEFEVYPNDSIDSDTYSIHIKARDILRITAYDDDHCFLYVHHNEVDISRYLVRYGIEAIYNILIGGSTTTGEDFSWSSYWKTQIEAWQNSGDDVYVSGKPDDYQKGSAIPGLAGQPYNDGNTILDPSHAIRQNGYINSFDFYWWYINTACILS